jgi:hypothetical protein
MEEQIFNGLITFPNKETFNNFVNTMDKDTAMKIIELSVDYGLKNGIYNLSEAMCLHKSLTKIKE